ncbi:hypothetical protein DL98DRAFT_439729, partial [Cadophora sp. DSE1049]
NKMASALQAQVDANLRTMRETINNLPERKERLDSFENRTDGLSITSHGSCDGATEIRKRVWWKGRMCLISSVIILLLVIVVLPIVILMLQHHNY